MFKMDYLDEKEMKKITLVITMFLFTIMVIMLPQMNALADESSGAEVVTSSFSTLISIVTALVSSIGTLVLMWGFFEWGTSLQGQEGVMQASAFKRVGGGLVMVLAPQLVTAFVG